MLAEFNFLIPQQTFIGMLIAFLSTLGLMNGRRLLQLSHVLKRVVERHGEDYALRLIRIACGGGIVLGIGLILRLINPVNWN